MKGDPAANGPAVTPEAASVSSDPTRATRLSIRVQQVKWTCQHHDIDPSAYLQDLLLRLSSQPADQLEELLADVWLTPHPWAGRKVAS